jgi:hypothetical protein
MQIGGLPVKWEKGLALINVVVPLIGMGLMIFYAVCTTSCSYLQGTFAGVDLKITGIIFMALLLALTRLDSSRLSASVGHLRTMMLAGAVGSEILLVRFQVVHDTYCPFCIAFGFCVVLLFAVNFPRMNRLLALLAFLMGIGLFALFFNGSVLPRFS